MALNPQNATSANVSSSATAVTLFAANPLARSRSIWNDSSAVVYLKNGTGAAATSCKVKVLADGYYEWPDPVYTGVVTAIWASANGSARTSEEY